MDGRQMFHFLDTSIEILREIIQRRRRYCHVPLLSYSKMHILTCKFSNAKMKKKICLLIFIQARDRK